MSFWGRAGLLAAGAAAGYLASGRGRKLLSAGQDLVVRGGADMTRSGTPTAGAAGEAMTRLWSSAPAAPLRAGALKAVRFAAAVRQGMQEREAELTERYAMQKTSPRPGALDPWAEELEATEEETSLSGEQARVLEHRHKNPRARDADLPETFFHGTD